MAVNNKNALKDFVSSRHKGHIRLFGDCSSFLEKKTRLPEQSFGLSGRGLRSRGERITDLQESWSARGYRQAALVWSIRGWTVRYASGLQGRAIMRDATGFTPEDALEFAKEWVEQDPERREVIVRRHSVKSAEKDGHDQSAIHALDC